MRRSKLFGLLMTCVSPIFAYPDWDFTGYSSDTTVYINGGALPLVVQGGTDAIIADGYYRGITVTSTGVALRATGGTGIEAAGGLGLEATGTSTAGISASGITYGVIGGSTNGVGGRFISTNSTGLEASGYSRAITGSTTAGWGSAIYGAGGTGTGVEGNGYVGVYGYGTYTYGSGTAVGAFGQASGSYNAIGVLGEASGGSNDNWAGYFNGKVYASGGFTPSDAMFKKNVAPLTHGLDLVMALAPKTYDMKVDEFKGRVNLPKGKQFGLIAQEVEKVVPEIVSPISSPVVLTEEERKNGVKKDPVNFKAVDYTSLIPVLIQAIKEQQAEIEELKRALGR